MLKEYPALRLVLQLASLAVVIVAFGFISLWMVAYAFTSPGVPTYLVWPALVAVLFFHIAIGVILGRRYIADTRRHLIQTEDAT